MSWWVYLCEDRDWDRKNDLPPTVTLEQPHSEGGTYVLGGSTAAEVNVTYNYGARYRDVLGHNLIDWLNGKLASETVPDLERVVAELGTERGEDYWEASPGNAGAAAATLLSWAKDAPAARWLTS